MSFPSGITLSTITRELSGVYVLNYYGHKAGKYLRAEKGSQGEILAAQRQADCKLLAAMCGEYHYLYTQAGKASWRNKAERTSALFLLYSTGLALQGRETEFRNTHDLYEPELIMDCCFSIRACLNVLDAAPGIKLREALATLYGQLDSCRIAAEGRYETILNPQSLHA